jgi:hypothetical protein
MMKAPDMVRIGRERGSVEVVRLSELARAMKRERLGE